MSPSAPVPAGSPEAKLGGEFLVFLGTTGQKYRAQGLALVEGFNVKIEAGIVVVEDAVIAKLPVTLQIVVKSIIGAINTYVDGDLPALEGQGYDALCAFAISEGQKLQA